MGTQNIIRSKIFFIHLHFFIDTMPFYASAPNETEFFQFVGELKQEYGNGWNGNDDRPMANAAIHQKACWANNWTHMPVPYYAMYHNDCHKSCQFRKLRDIGSHVIRLCPWRWHQ